MYEIANTILIVVVQLFMKKKTKQNKQTKQLIELFPFIMNYIFPHEITVLFGLPSNYVRV
jgi:hypothetical protein